MFIAGARSAGPAKRSCGVGVKTKTSGLLESSARAVAGAKLVAGSCRRRGARETGGANRDRTDDLLLAKQALSQLSYGPTD